MNKVILQGRLTKDAEVKQTKTKKKVAKITLAVDRKAKKGDDKTADFFDVYLWEKMADVVEKYTKKGQKVLIEGYMQNDSYDDKDGKKVYRNIITATDFYFCEFNKELASDSDVDKPF